MNLKRDPLFADLVARLTGDGHLQFDKSLVSFYSKNIEEINNVKKVVYNLFRVSGKIYVDNREPKRYKLFFISAPLSIYLKGVGVPVGNKTNVAFDVPDWILEGEKKIKRAYLQGIYDSEGYVYSNKSGRKLRWRIGISMCKNENIVENGISYMDQLRSMLSLFDIISSPVRTRHINIRKDGSKSREAIFEIEFSSFRNFYKYVGFKNKKKQDKLTESLAICGGN